MAMDLKELSLIKKLYDAMVEIQDLAGDGNHYSATVTSTQFSGKAKLNNANGIQFFKRKMETKACLAIKTKENNGTTKSDLKC